MKWFVEDYLQSDTTKKQIKQDFVRFLEEFAQEGNKKVEQQKYMVYEMEFF